MRASFALATEPQRHRDMKGKDTFPLPIFAFISGKAPLIARLLQEERYEITLETVNASNRFYRPRFPHHGIANRALDRVFDRLLEVRNDKRWRNRRSRHRFGSIGVRRVDDRFNTFRGVERN